MSERTLEQALAHADIATYHLTSNCTADTAHADLVLLADEVKRLRGTLKDTELQLSSAEDELQYGE